MPKQKADVTVPARSKKPKNFRERARAVMTGKQLAGEARSRGLKVGGKKMELVARLEADDAARSAERGDAGERAEASEASAR